MTSDIETERLLAETEWLRRLARSLVTGRDAADDVVQETLLRALHTPAVGLRNVRGWLAAVATSVASRFARTAVRQQARFARLPRKDPEPSVADAVAHAEAQQRVIGALLGMPEPYRSVLVLRYQRELGYAAIATHLGVPLETVRTQIKRGLQRLREVLDEGPGGRAAWAGLLPSAFVRTTAAALPLLACAGVVLGAAWFVAHDSAPPARAAATVAAGFATTDASRATSPPADQIVRSPVAAEVPRAVARETAPSRSSRASGAGHARWMLRGRVVDVRSGAPIEGAEVRRTKPFVRITPESGTIAEPPCAFSDHDGRFQLPAGGGEVLVVRASGYATQDVWSQELSAGLASDVGCVWMETQVMRSFRVLTWNGLPAAGAELHAFTVTEQRAWSDVVATCDDFGVARGVLPTRRDGRTSIVATHGTAVGVAEIGRSTTDQVIRLGATADLIVDVVDDEGKAVRCEMIVDPRGVPTLDDSPRLAATPLLAGKRRIGHTDPSGRAVLRSLPLPAHAGTCRLTVVAYGRRGECRDVQLQAGTNVERVVLPRGASATMRGRVVDAETLRPIAGAAVGRQARSGDDGTFVIADLDLRGGRVHLAVHASGYLPGRIDEPVGGRAGELMTNIALRPAVRITGTVADAKGGGIAAVRMLCDGVPAIRSGAGGRFAFDVPRGRVTLRVEPPFSPLRSSAPFDVVIDSDAVGPHEIVVGGLPPR